MNPDQAALDQFDLDVRVSNPREAAEADAQPQMISRAMSCMSCIGGQGGC